MLLELFFFPHPAYRGYFEGVRNEIGFLPFLSRVVAPWTLRWNGSVPLRRIPVRDAIALTHVISRSRRSQLLYFFFFELRSADVRRRFFLRGVGRQGSIVPAFEK